MHKEIDTHSACKEDAGIRLRTTRREFLLASFVVPLVGCGLRGTGNQYSGQMGVEQLRSALMKGDVRDEQKLILDNSNIPVGLEFLGRLRTVVWSDHTESEIISFELDDGREARKHDNWPDRINAYSHTVSLVLPRGIYAGDGLNAMLQGKPRWYDAMDLETYASTMLVFHGFYLTDDGKQSGANVLNYVSVTFMIANCRKGN